MHQTHYTTRCTIVRKKWLLENATWIVSSVRRLISLRFSGPAAATINKADRGLVREHDAPIVSSWTKISLSKRTCSTQLTSSTKWAGAVTWKASIQTKFNRFRISMRRKSNLCKTSLSYTSQITNWDNCLIKALHQCQHRVRKTAIPHKLKKVPTMTTNFVCRVHHLYPVSTWSLEIH